MATGTHERSFQMLRTGDKFSFLDPRTSSPRPVSEATEILDTDFDDEFLEEYFSDSPRRSVGSLATESISTASTFEDVPTPNSTALTGFRFQLDEKPIEGPVGPHLFRSSMDSAGLMSSLEVDFILADSPGSNTAPLCRSASKHEPLREATVLPSNVSRQAPPTTTTSLNQAASALNGADIGSWTPEDVVSWMRNSDFDDGLIEKFFINDISGAILLELQYEDLKELDIHSFGKRRRLMNAIQNLRDGATPANGGVQMTQPKLLSRDTTWSSEPSAAVSNNDPNPTPIADEEQVNSPKHRRGRRATDINPGDSVSIVAIEQLLPKMHKCSKGAECHKWQRQQRKLAMVAKDLKVDTVSGSAILAGDPGNPTTAPNLANLARQDVSPSIVASSDVLGPQTAPIRLCEEKLNEVKSRDPQENVRRFLNFQHVSQVQPIHDPATPTQEASLSPNVESPDSAKTSDNLAEHLRHLPRLRIPSTHAPSSGSALSAGLSAQRTVTPGILKQNPQFPLQNTPFSSDQPFIYGSVMSPADYYRQGTPFSEMDVPVTALPVGPIERDVSQSVPPDMRFGSDQVRMADPVMRPSSTKGENHRRNTSFQNVPALERLDENNVTDLIETPEDLHRTPWTAGARNRHFSPVPRKTNDVTHSGWMKKRKTTRLLRHEWEDHHFTLKGTQLAMHADERASRRDSKALEHIDVDDYAVACSSFASNSKLTAAFKKTVLKRRDTAQNEAAFAFSLIPAASNGNAPNVDRKALFTNGKSHHFAVKTRDERIDWMRELMLAKALKRGKEGGDAVRLNGNVM